MHSSLDEVPFQRRQKDGSVEIYSANQANLDYSKHMGYVDKADMLKSLYEVDRKSHKWWHRIFFHLLDVSLVNSYIIHKDITQESQPLKDYKISVIHGLAGASGMTSRTQNTRRLSQGGSGTHPASKRHKVNVPIEIRTSETQHLPERLQNGQQRCNLCSTKAAPHRTWYQCNICNL